MRNSIGLFSLLLVLPPAALQAAGDGLGLEARIVGSDVRAVLVNRSAQRIKVFVGYLCQGPDHVTYDTAPFTLQVDGQRREPLACSAADRSAQLRTLAPGERYEASLTLAQEEDQGAHLVVVRYQPEPRFRGCWARPLASPARPWPGTLALAVRVGGRSQKGVELEIVHENISSQWMTAFTGDACGKPIFDTLLVDGAPYPLFAPIACRGEPGTRPLPPGASFVTHARLLLPPGQHTVQATYQALRSREFTLMLEGVSTRIAYGHMTWSGNARSAVAPIDVK
jgi:hypothetical protein